MITRTSYPVTEEARGPVNEHMEMIPLKDLLNVHLDYALALLMPFDTVNLEHIGGLRPAWVVVETENEKRQWSPSSNKDHAKEALGQLGLTDQGYDREALEKALRKHVAPVVEIPILTSHDVGSPYISRE